MKRKAQVERWARFFLWGSLVLFLLSIGSCWGSCASIGAQSGGTFFGFALIGFIAVALSFCSLLVGAVLKMLAPADDDQ